MSDQIQSAGQSVKVRLATSRGDIKVVVKDFREPKAQQKMEKWLDKQEESGNLIEVMGYSDLW